MNWKDLASGSIRHLQTLRFAKKTKEVTLSAFPSKPATFNVRLGISFTSGVKNPKLDIEAVKAVCAEYRIHNADVHCKDDCEIDDVVDVIEGSRVYVPVIYVINKIDQITLEELNVLDQMPHYCPICAYHEWNLDGLVEMIWEYLDLVRVYTKPKGKLPDYEDPVVLPRARCMVEDFCNKIHKTILKQFKHALVCPIISHSFLTLFYLGLGYKCAPSSAESW